MKSGLFESIRRLADGSAGWTKHSRPLLDRLFSRWIPPRAETAPDWTTDADWAHADQSPLRARYLLRLVAVLLVLFIVWAALAEIDEVTRGSGKVIPSRQVQVVQAVDGGVVSEILVREGQSVEAGQLLFRIDKTRFVSSLRENRVQYLALVAKAARLQALADGAAFRMPDGVAQEDPALAESERNLYESRRSELDTQLNIARQLVTQRNQELVEARSRRDEAARSYDLTARELSMTRPLAASGAVSDVELLRLERDVNRYRGERDQASAQIQRLQSSIAEANSKVREHEISFRNEMRNELAETMAKLNSLSEGSAALSDKVKQADVRSPVRGTIKRLLVTTVGGVLQPGREIVEIVPSDDELLLETRISPKDIAYLYPGQAAMVRFTAYDFAVYGSIKAQVEQIGADTVTDDDGNAFFIVRVRTREPDLGKSMPILPGMVAEVDILTGKKSVLSYLLKPVLRAQTHAFTER